MVNVIDCIPDSEPHCAVCEYWKDENELFALCEIKNQYCPSFAICDNFSSTMVR